MGGFEGTRMLAFEDDTSILSDFGFTPNQAKVYMTILRLGTASVGAISKASKVRREDIYRMLPKLEKMGLTERVLGAPARIRAIPAESAFAVLIARQKDEASEKLSALTARSQEFLKLYKFGERKINTEEGDSQFCLISERHAILSKTDATVESANRSIDIVTSRKKLAQILFNHADLIRKAMKRGVKVRIATETPEEEDSLPSSIEEQLSPGYSIQLKYIDALPSHYIMIDERDVFIATSTEELLGESPSLWTDNKSVIRLVQSSFEAMWQAASSWTAIRTRPRVRKQIVN
jgi:sugar-specific transcriptional regulator TrmB